jgi:internalin A
MIKAILINKTKLTYNSFNEIVNYDKIIELNCSDNKLTFLPDLIGYLINLKVLNCSFNKLTFLPESIGNLINLKELDCCNNQLRSLPESIGELINLKELHFTNNELTFLPESIGNLSNLNNLFCLNNQIKELPESIINLKNIDYISKCVLTLTLTPQQERYFKWIKSRKSYPFNEYIDMVMVKCAYFGV